MDMKLQDLLKKVNSDSGKLILMYLQQVTKATVREISTALDFTLAKTYGVLQSLSEKEVVSPCDQPNEYTIAQHSP